MSRTATYNTVWGELIVSYVGDQQILHSKCKSCFEETEQAIPKDVNPFAAAKPGHKTTCRFSRTAKPEMRGPAPVVTLPPLTGPQAPPLWLIVLVALILVLMGLGAGVAL